MKNTQIPSAPPVRAEIPSTDVPADPTTDAPPTRSRLSQEVLPWLTSLTVHAALVVFGVMTATVIMAPPPPVMQEQVNAAVTTVREDMNEVPRVFENAKVPDFGEEPSQDRIVEVPPDGVSRSPGSKFDVDAGGGANADGTVADRIAIGEKQFMPGKNGGPGGNSVGDGTGDGGPPAIFNSRSDGRIGSAIFQPPVPARRIVFVCDATGTMIQKLGVLKHELTKAVAALRPNQSFNIIFFTDGGKYHIANKSGVVVATPDNKRQAFAFLEDITPMGTTDPLPAIDAAFRQTPDLVYFLSDGEFNNLRPYEEVVRQFDSSNKERRTRVSTILFETYDRDAEQVMRRIAEDHGGSYRFTRVDDLE